MTRLYSESEVASVSNQGQLERFLDRTARYVLSSVGLDLEAREECRRKIMCSRPAGIRASMSAVEARIRAVHPAQRLPLFPVSESPRKITPGWRLPQSRADISALDRQTPQERRSTWRRWREVPWGHLGERVDAVVRDYFCLPAEDLSYCVFGSFLSNDAPSDLDVAAVIEDPSCGLVEVGSHSLPATELAGVLGPTQRALNMIDVSLVGRGALSSGAMSHDLQNLAVWTNKSGVCLQGAPLVAPWGVGHALLIQEALVSLGFMFKGLLSNPDPTKPSTVIADALDLTAWVARQHQDISDAEALVLKTRQLKGALAAGALSLETPEALVTVVQQIAAVARSALDTVKAAAVEAVPELCEKD